jgi:predicted esterase
MASHKPQERGARLGRRVTPGRFGSHGVRAGTGTAPGGRGRHGDEPRPGADDVRAVVLVLPGGDANGTGRPPGRRAAAVRPLARYVVRAAGPEAGVAAYVVRYRVRGWNGERADQAADAAEAVREVTRRCGADVPVALVGVGVGARAALAAAGDPAVRAVAAVAPWLTPEGVEQDPVRQLIGRQVLVVHGTYDRATPPDLSFRLSERAKKVNPDVCRFEVHGGGHRLDRHRPDVAALTTDFVLGALLGRRLARPVEDALAAPPPIGLRMPLDVSFGRPTGTPRPNDPPHWRH